MTPEEWRRNIDLNLNGAILLLARGAGAFPARGGGFIVNISSLAGKNGVQRRRRVQCLQVRAERVHRGPDARSSLRQGARVLHHAGQRGYGSSPAGPSTARGDTSWMIAPEDVAEAVALVLRMPARTMISRVEMRPSRPKK